MLRTDHGLFTGNRPLGAHTDLCEHTRNAQTGIRIIVCHQHLQSLQVFDLFVRLFLTT